MLEEVLIPPKAAKVGKKEIKPPPSPTRGEGIHIQIK
jgi:hypothetical protein